MLHGAGEPRRRVSTFQLQYIKDNFNHNHTTCLHVKVKYTATRSNYTDYTGTTQTLMEMTALLHDDPPPRLYGPDLHEIMQPPCTQHAATTNRVCAADHLI
jgi:hypothetical protein